MDDSIRNPLMPQARGDSAVFRYENPTVSFASDKKIPAFLSVRGIKDIASEFSKIGDGNANVNKNTLA
ncbi:hypothetical protein [Noviherbaspirillum pedocola]|uniref:Uncharacterized protein n=1 Tax=Noviherbaspirillum pedocola TaxID=2801341 RepID=A0A934W7Q1_9BURK|nr:hypothetical protein [Noviherbaspirillum pedocola]MBK4737712.1 hypothetical protein [Noviherbaspirillum pedocola]